MSAPDFPSQPSPDSNVENRIRKDATSVADTARHDIKELGDEIKHEAGAIATEARDQVEQAAETAKGLAEDQKRALADQLDGVSNSFDKVANELEDKGESSAHYVRMVADGARKLTSAVRENNVDDMIGMAEDFGRKQPVPFMGAAALLGFAASRFMVASASRRAEQAPRPADASESVSSNSPAQKASKPSYAQSVGGSDAGI